MSPLSEIVPTLEMTPDQEAMVVADHLTEHAAEGRETAEKLIV